MSVENTPVDVSTTNEEISKVVPYSLLQEEREKSKELQRQLQATLERIMHLL
jgi:hypothetical protein